MEYVGIVLLLLLGLVLIVKGGDFFVDAASWMAEVSGIPKLIVGATVVSFATTLPETIVSVIASLEGSTGMCVGNAIGSVTANIGLIMAISVLCIPAAVKRKEFAGKAFLLILTVAVLCGFALDGRVEIWEGILLLVLFAIFAVENVSKARKASLEDKSERPAKDKKTVIINIVKFVLGAAGIVIGSRLLVDNGTTLAERMGVSDGIIGATIVAVGTSLPELVTTLTAVAKKESSLSIGNVIGANIIDAAIILPVCGLLSGGALETGKQGALLDIPICLVITLLALVPTLISERFRRWQGIVLLVVYAAYVAAVCTGAVNLL